MWIAIWSLRIAIKTLRSQKQQDKREKIRRLGREVENVVQKTKLNNWLKPSNLEKIRGTVLGTGNVIEEGDFVDEIRKYFRKIN